MWKIRIMSFILSASMITCIIGVVNVYAIEEQKAEGEVLFQTDFESENPGSNPTSIIATGTVDDSTVLSSGSNNDTKHLLFKKRLRALFDNNAKDSGILYVDFDAMATEGYLSVSLLYSGSTTTYGKWIFGMPKTDGAGFLTWQELNGIPPEAPTATFKKKGTTELIRFSQNTWNSYRLKVDIDHSSVTLFVDGVESGTINNYEYFGGLYSAIGGVGFRNDNSDNNTYIDNIKIHWEETETYYKTIFADNFENGTSKWYEAGTTNVVANDTSAIGGTVTKGTALSLYGAPETVTPSDPNNTVFALNSSLGTGKTVYTTFSENVSDNLCIEAEFQGGYACMGIGLLEVNKTVDSKYILNVPSANNKFSYSTSGTFINSTNTTYNTPYVKQGTSTNLVINKNQWQHVKFVINLTTGTVKTYIDTVELEEVTLPYIQGKTIRGIELANNRALLSGSTELDHIKYFDNIKVYTTSDGNSVSDLKTGSNKVRVTFKDAVDANTLTTGNVEIVDTNGAVKTISRIEALSSTEALIVLADAMNDGISYVIRLSDGIKYADGYAILPYVNTFTYTKGSFTAEVLINDVSLTQTGIDATATCTVSAYDLSNRNIQLILAAYEGSKLIGVKLQDYQYDESNYRQDILNISESFEIPGDTVKVFVWDENLIPFCDNGTWEASN